MYAADDMTGDGLADVAFATQTCDPLACYTGADVIAWRPSLESFDSLLPFQLREPAGEVTIEDLEGDGIKEIVVRTGSLPSPSAGPQRSRVTTLR
ncbi:MAG: hypothetical protein GWO02_17060, partial [Gammaproteobacteria bacterium]|nr:hypothetical protein [Gammaproteobacteria bacterium]